MKRILAFLLCSALTAFCAITERYVSFTGTDTYANSTSSSTPMSLATAFTNATALDRINVKADGAYQIASPGVTISANGPIFWRGYTTTITDGGIAQIQGAATGTSYQPITLSGNAHQWENIQFSRNGSSGTAVHWFNATGARNQFIRCQFTDCRLAGVYNWPGTINLYRCEAYGCVTANIGTGNGGVNVNVQGSSFIECYTHDHTAGTSANGAVLDGGIFALRSIFANNTGAGCASTADTTAIYVANDFYNNGLSGTRFDTPTDMVMANFNNNFIKNSRWGFEITTTGSCNGVFFNNGFGSGTAVNTLGTVETMEGNTQAGLVTYPSNSLPWAGSGNYTVSLTEAKGTGWGSFLQINPAYSGTVGYPDIGSSQHNE